ncbi:MAG: ABC transporter permease subunit [Malacoplasma sp.]
MSISKLFSKNKTLTFFRSSYIYIILLLIYIPLIFIVALSFNGESQKGNIILDFDNPNTNNYIQLFKNDEFLNSFFNSFFVALAVAPISLIIAVSTCFGLWYSRNKKVNRVINNMVTTNIAIPDIIFGISLTLLFTSVWLPLGLDYGYFTIVFSHISFCVPYAILAIYPRMLKFNKNLINASNDLGASKTRTFFKIVLPFLLPAIISATIIVIAISFDDFVITTLVRGNFLTISTAIYQSSKGIKAWIVTFGAIMVIGFILGSLIIATRKSWKENLKRRR